MVSVSTAIFDGYPLERGLDVLAELGVKAVEPAFIRGYVDFDESAFEPAAARRLAAAIAARGLTVQALSAHMDLSGEDAVTALSRRIACAHELGTGILITNAGPAVARREIIATIETVAPMLEQAGIRLALENSGDRDGDLLGSPGAAAAFASGLDMPPVGLNVDIANFATLARGLEGLAGIEVALRRAFHVHMKTYRDDGTGWHFPALPDGCIDLRSLAEPVGALPIGIEMPLRLRRPGHGRPIRVDPVPIDVIRDAISRSLAHLRDCGYAA